MPYDDAPVSVLTVLSRYLTAFMSVDICAVPCVLFNLIMH
jgi:hypothetical protein